MTAINRINSRQSLGNSFLLLVLMLLVLTGCTSTSNNNVLETAEQERSLVGTQDGDLTVVKNLPPPENLSSTTAQKINASDVLEIDVFQVNELDRTVRVEANETISMPLIGNVKTANLTIPELELVLEKRYNQKYLQNAEITVFMKESFGQRVTMDGEFTKPGIYPSTSQTTLLQAVALAGGLTTLADEKKIFVYREFSNGKKVANYSIADIRAGKHSDPNIYGGDVIVAFTSKSKIAMQNLRQALGIATSATRVVSPL